VSLAGRQAALAFLIHRFEALEDCQPGGGGLPSLGLTPSFDLGGIETVCRTTNGIESRRA
jgi:hypothetical protein